MATILARWSNRCLACAWRRWTSSTKVARADRLRHEAEAERAALREDFRSRLQGVETQMARERAELESQFEGQLSQASRASAERAMRGMVARWRGATTARCVKAWRDWCEDCVRSRADLLGRLFDAWRWFVAASRRHLTRKLRAECAAAAVKIHELEVEKMQDKETVRVAFEQIEEHFEEMMRARQGQEGGQAAASRTRSL